MGFSACLNDSVAVQKSSVLRSPRLDLNDHHAIPILSSLADFFQSQRDLFDECKKHGQFKSGTSGYRLNSPVRLKEEKRSMRPFDSHVAYMKWNAEEVCLPPREKFRIE